MVEASTVRFTFGRYDQFEFVHHGQLTDHPEEDRKVHACRVCGDPCLHPRRYYCSGDCADHWYEEVTGPTRWTWWRKKVQKRDGYTCQICGHRPEGVDEQAFPWKGNAMHVDHIQPVRLYPELEFEPDNLRTLCEDCHHEHGANPNPGQVSIAKTVDPTKLEELKRRNHSLTDFTED